MGSYHLAIHAERDMFDVWVYIAKDSETAADKMLYRLTEHFIMLSDNPFLGRLRDNLLPGMRSYPVHSFVILYQPIDDGVEILRILSGYRDLDTIFTEA